MGIYIPGIEMPKGHNYVTITIWSSGAVSSVLFDREGVLRDFKDFKELKAVPVPEHKETKAVHVPEHGRLIDADALEASCFMGSSSFYTQSDIDYAPTIIPASEEGE